MPRHELDEADEMAEVITDMYEQRILGLEADCRTLEQRAADAEALVLSHEGHISRLESDLAAANDKLNRNRCNLGHVTLPLKLWNCPECCRLREEKLEADLREALAALREVCVHAARVPMSALMHPHLLTPGAEELRQAFATHAAAIRKAREAGEEKP